MTVKQIVVAIVLMYIVYWLYANLLVRTKEGQRSVVVRLGKLYAIHGPGVSIKIPNIDRIITIDLAKEVPNWRGLSEAELKDRVYSKVTGMLGS